MYNRRYGTHRTRTNGRYNFRSADGGALSNPFGIDSRSGTRDPDDTPINQDQITRLQNDDQTKELALRHLHDPQQFAQLFVQQSLRPNTRRLMRKLVQMQTINAVLNGFYRLPDGKKIELNKDDMIEAALNTVCYGPNQLYHSQQNQLRAYNKPVEIIVVNGDCLDVALYFKNNYPNCNPLVLNMASSNHPGGGWRVGAGAQEENLHRRSNLFQCLEDPYRALDRQWNYQVPEFGGIYSPNVLVFRGSEENGYPFFADKPEYLSFVACAAYKSPPLETDPSDGQIKIAGKNMIQKTKKKIEALLRIALDQQHDTVILSALGCGAYGNPPRHMAQLFREVISEHFSQSFNYLVFAIFDDHNANKKHNPNGNVVPFAEVFKVPPLFLDELDKKNQQQKPGNSPSGAAAPTSTTTASASSF